MGYYMRFFDTSEDSLQIHSIEAGLRQSDPTYRLEIQEDASRPQADMYRGEELLAEIEINQAEGDDQFGEEIDEFLEEIESAEEPVRAAVEVVFKNTKRLVCVRVLGGDRDATVTLAEIQPLWDWLFAMRTGLLQADGEGFYDVRGLILETG